MNIVVDENQDLSQHLGMQIKSREHYELMQNFEKRFKKKPEREPKELWNHSIYCDGNINRDFLSFREGYALAKGIYQNQ